MIRRRFPRHPSRDDTATVGFPTADTDGTVLRLTSIRDWVERMAALGGIVGAVLGIAIAVFFTEVVFPNNQEWPIVFVGVGAAGGWLIGSGLVRRMHHRSAKLS
jgi:hypothetical protein